MSSLPKGWVGATLGEIAIWGSGGTPSRSERHYYGGGIPWVKTGELGPRLITTTEETISEAGLANSSAKMFPSGSVAIAMYGATIGKTSILGIPATTNQACAVGIPHPEITGNAYLYHFLRAQKDAFAEAGKGGAQPNISQAVIKGWPVPVAPLPEQKRIADKLDTVLARVDACRDRLDRLPALLKRFRQSILAAATSGRLTEDWRQGGNPPLGPWPYRRLEAVASKVGSGSTPRGGEASYQKQGVPLIRSMNIVFFGFKRDGIAYLDSSQAHDLRNVAVRPKDVLLNITGASIGRVTVAPLDMNDARVNQHVCIIRASAEILPEFLCAYLAAPEMQSAIGAENYGVTRQALTKQQILDFSVPIPAVTEQHEIVRRVKILFAFADRLEARLATARKQVDQLTPALLAKAFRGELVPQDPADEPASELLKRIAATRATTPSAKRGRKVAS